MVIGLSGVQFMSVIIRMMTKSDDRAAGVRFVYHEYNYRPGAPGLEDTQSPYQLIGVLKTHSTV